MNNENINLARKLRPKNFDQIVGQQLCVRILKNGLYLNTFFPVYLFSGQRGCGKTTSARVFAASVNCLKLADFQQNPKQPIPCYTCKSCEFMTLGKHPDFIEIDAASHTGVDNVRQIIESSSFMPLIGRKKIYLIDEAHMLSKAAFNAFLKILEEPPATVLFILATTDVQKIIDTVRSRSFQLFFSSISETDLVGHLEEICKNESINYEIEGLKAIVKESQGSARDAINLLEQVKFSTSNVTKAGVLNILGHISDEYLLQILNCVINQTDVAEFVNYLEEIKFGTYSAEYIFNKFNEILNISIKIKFGVNLKTQMFKDVQKVAKDFSSDRLLFVIQEFFKSELLFLKTINKHLFLEILLLRLLTTDTKKNIAVATSNTISPKTKVSTFKQPEKIVKSAPLDDRPFVEYQEIKDNIVQVESPIENIEIVPKTEWDIFLQEIKNNADPILNSIFSQANYKNYDKEIFKVTVTFGKNFTFFNDIINENATIWTPILNRVYGQKTTLELNFNENEIKRAQEIKKVEQVNVARETNYNSDNQRINQGNRVDVSDKSKWKTANSLLDSFPGTIEEIG